MMNANFNQGAAEKHLLIVEDSPVQAKKLRFLLEENGYKTQVCTDGKEAMKFLSGSRPLLIISDIVMPGMDGYELCSAIKSSHDLKGIPVILLTSLRDPLDIIRGLQAGADNFITKPYEEHYLLSRIQYLLLNHDFRQGGGAEMVIEIMFRGKKYAINSEKKQILDLLLSVFEAAIQRNDELIQTQAQLETANEDLTAANHELESFAQTVSHDLRSPLHLIKGYAQIILDEYSSVMPPEVLKYLAIMDQSVNSMAGLVEDLLNFSMSGKAELKIGKVDLTGIATNIIERLKMMNPERQVETRIESGLQADADPGLIGIVLENLLNNAWKYSGKNPAAVISLGSKIENGEKLFFISDNGDGFDMSGAYKLFKPFQRLHTRQEFQGTGVGLATVSRIIERHGGHIRAEGKKGEGATFSWTLSS